MVLERGGWQKEYMNLQRVAAKRNHLRNWFFLGSQEHGRAFLKTWLNILKCEITNNRDESEDDLVDEAEDDCNSELDDSFARELFKSDSESKFEEVEIWTLIKKHSISTVSRFFIRIGNKHCNCNEYLIDI